jgi:hypothetical protein
MLASSGEVNPQVGRSVRARLESRLPVRYSSERAIADTQAFERAVTAIAKSTMDSIPVLSDANSADHKAEDCQAELVGFLSSFIVGMGNLKERLLEIAEREEE